MKAYFIVADIKYSYFGRIKSEKVIGYELVEIVGVNTREWGKSYLIRRENGKLETCGSYWLYFPV